MIANGDSRRTGTTAALVAVLCATAVAAYVAWAEFHSGRFHSDLDVQLAGVRYLLSGRNPYLLIGPGREFPWPATLYHPVPALLVLAPFSWMPLSLARPVFAGVTCFALVLAFGLTRQPLWRYASLVSRCAQMTALLGQWSFLFAAAWLLPVLNAFAIVKPNIGAVVVGARVERRWLMPAVFGGAILLAGSFVVAPGWPHWWLASVAVDPNRGMAITRPGGPLLLLAALRWRRPEARLLLGMSVIPQTLGSYDALLLFFIPQRATEALALVALSYMSFAMGYGDPITTVNAAIVANGVRVVHWIYLPALAMVLVRPNRTSMSPPETSGPS